MSDAVRRVAVQISGESGGTVVDLALPGAVEVAELIPAIMDLVGSVDTESPATWQLSRIGGPTLDASRSLTQNGVRDGELLLLTSSGIAPPAHRDPTGSSRADDDRNDWPPGLSRFAGLWLAIAGTVTVAWSGLMRADAIRTIPAALLTLGAAAAILPWRHRRDQATLTVSALIVVALATALGLLAVPDGPTAANVLLAAAAGSAAAATMMRVSRAGTIPLGAVATCGAILAVSMTPAALWSVSTPAVGALLVTASIGVLGLAPRFSIALSGLTPTLDIDAEPDRDVPHDDDQMVRGNAILTGLLTGAAIAAVVGTAAVALGSGQTAPWWVAATFVAVVAAALLLRARSHADTARRVVLIGTGTTCATVALGAAVVHLDRFATVPGALAVGIGFAVTTGLAGSTVSPLIRRAADLVEYLALAALLPLACWVGGVYGLVRGLTLW